MPAALEEARSAYDRRHWSAAVRAFHRVEGAMEADDLEKAATAAYLVGHEADANDLLTRAHEEHLARGDAAAAARCAGWLGVHLADQGDRARASGWFARAARLVEPDRPEGAYALIPRGLGALYAGDAEGARAAFAELAEFAERSGDRDVSGLAALGGGQARIMAGHVAEGLALFDEAMVAVTAGEISPVPAGIIYCGVIGNCQLAFDLRRALEWTAALDHWCQAQPDLVAFSGQCQVHRAQLYCLHGAWSEALDAARVAQERYPRGDRQAAFGAHYQEGEIRRLRGELDAAEEAYRRAGASGWDPQPGLALVVLARGRAQAAQSLLRSAAEGADPTTRRRMLPALVDIELAAGDVPAARRGADELTALWQATPMPMLDAVAAFATGAVLLREGDARGALERIRRATAVWRELDVPYEIARCRALLALAHTALGEEESAEVAAAAARRLFEELGAVPALAELDARARSGGGPLTSREIEVLRLVASGRTNKAIAAALYLSEKTVARHLSNIFAKLGLSSRAAATAYAYEHRLI